LQLRLCIARPVRDPRQYGCACHAGHDHLATDAACFPEGQVAIAAVGQVYARFLGSLHLHQ